MEKEALLPDRREKEGVTSTNNLVWLLSHEQEKLKVCE